MLARLESAVKRLSQFAADASHELRTPLAVIRTTAELALRRARPPESYRESLSEDRRRSRAHDPAGRGSAGPGAPGGTGSVADAPLPRDRRIARLLRDVCAELRSLAETRQIAIEERSWATPRPIVSGNRAALHRLFWCLLDNAIKYSHPGGDVILTVDQAGDQVTVTIAGFRRRHRSSRSAAYFRALLPRRSSRSGGGHGLGLSLAENIARAHGATIDVDSSGRRIALPRVFPASDPQPARFSQPSASASTIASVMQGA